MHYARKAALLVVFMAILQGCFNPENREIAGGSGISGPVVLKDYGRALFSIDPTRLDEGLDSLSDEFGFFTGDTLNEQQIIQVRDFVTDPFNIELHLKCIEVYGPAGPDPQGFSDLFGRIAAAWPGFKTPETYTYVSGLLYESPVFYADSVLVIALDMFLGRNFESYRAAGLPMYMTRRMEPANILPDCAREISFSLFPESFKPATLLDHMLLQGKVLYSVDRFLPGTPDSLKIGFTAGQIKWCENNESNLWRLFMDQEILFRADQHLVSRFILDGPFTAGLPDGAPAMTGRWIGWQIIRSYMNKHPKTSLEELFSLNDSQKILDGSGYRPRR
jgi:hypothetical protein